MEFPTADLDEFFGRKNTDTIMLREFVHLNDIDEEKYVSGSQSMPKKIIIYDESNLSKSGTRTTGYEVKGHKKIVEFEYGDSNFPTRWTSMKMYMESI